MLSTTVLGYALCFISGMLAVWAAPDFVAWVLIFLALIAFHVGSTLVNLPN